MEAAAQLPVIASGTVGDLHAQRGGLLSIIGKHQEALDAYARALDCARSAKDSARECRFLLGLSWAQFSAHQIEPMLDTCGRSRTLAEELGDLVIQASSEIANAQGKSDVLPPTILASQSKGCDPWLRRVTEEGRSHRPEPPPLKRSPSNLTKR